MTVSIENQILCVKREIMMRKRAYPRWVSDGRMTQEGADKELAAMQAVLETLNGLRPQGALNL